MIKTINTFIQFFIIWTRKITCMHRWYFRENIGIVCDLCGDLKNVAPAACSHKWVEVKAETISRNPVGSKKGNVIGTLFTLRCERCGSIEGKEVKIN